MTFSTYFSPGVALQGGGGSGGGGAASAPLTGTGATVTTSQPLIDVSQTWNASGVTFTGMRFNAAGTSDANSASASLLMDLQVGGASRFSVGKAGNATATNGSAAAPSFAMGTTGLYTRAVTARLNFTINGFDTGVEVGPSVVALQSTSSLSWVSGTLPSTSPDLILTRRDAANLRLGAADAAAPVPQLLSVQSVVAGTTNTAGQNFTITGSQGTGTGAGGSLIFQVAPAAGSSGSAQNALATALTIDNNKNATFYGSITGLNTGGGSTIQLAGSSTGFGVHMAAAYPVSWGSGATLDGSADVFLRRDTTNTLALRNGPAAAQRFNVYNTWNSTTNYETFKIDWITTPNTVLVGTEKGTGGGTARALEFQTDGTTRLSFSADNSFATFTSVNLITGSQIRVGNASRITNVSDGVIKITDGSEASFNRLQFGGTTSSFPALKRSSTTLQARLADDSAFASVQGKLTTETAYTAGAPTATGYIIIYDSTGTAYRVPALAN